MTVENKMIDLIKAGKTGKASPNTLVAKDSNGIPMVVLFGNPIAWVKPEGLMVSYGNHAPTITTKSRLHALLLEFCGWGLFSKQGKWFLSMFTKKGYIGSVTFHDFMTLSYK